MANLDTVKPVTFDTLISNIGEYSREPAAIQRVILEAGEEITNNKMLLVDPTNPFIFLLSNALAVHVSQLNHMDETLRRQYAALAKSDSEIYNHMSDNEYLNRFVTPALCSFNFSIDYDDLLQQLVYDPVEDLYRLTIPRDTEITINDIPFTFQYPIDIRKFNTGQIEVSYDGTYDSPIDELYNTIILVTVVTDINGKKWINFPVSLRQFKVTTKEYPVEKSVIFNQTIEIEDQFFYARVFQLDDISNKWIELKTTHSEQVYDYKKPTAILKALSTSLEVLIPPYYVLNNMVQGTIRVDIYTSKGSLNINMGSYNYTAFNMSFNVIDKQRDLTSFAAAVQNLACYAYSTEYLVDGTDGISFEVLRERNIMNANGDRQIPITDIGIEAKINDAGFSLIKNVDQLTNLIFLAARKLPYPINTNVSTPASIGINTFISNLNSLKLHPSVKDNGNKLTLTSNTLFKNDNGILKILSTEDINFINTLKPVDKINLLNNNQYLYNPFYYVLDGSNEEFDVRAYNLDYPELSNLSFDVRNETLSLIVSTGTYQIKKTNNGYSIFVITRSGAFYKQVDDTVVGMQLAYIPSGDTNYAYINGVLLGKNEDGERIYQFDLETNFDINSNHQLTINNAKMFSLSPTDTVVELEQELLLIHTTNSIVDTYKPINENKFVGSFILNDGSVLNSLEKIKLKIGTQLKNLWSRCRNVAGGSLYQTHNTDVPLVYNEPVYAKDPITGSIYHIENNQLVLNEILYQVGEVVRDENNDIVYRHRVGDVVFDNNGNPVSVPSTNATKEIDLLLVDGRYFFANSPALVSYRDEIVATIESWIVDQIDYFQSIALQKTSIYFYPKTTLGKVTVNTDSSNEDYLDAEQSFVLELYVPKTIFNDNDARVKLKHDAIRIIDSYISQDIVNIMEINDALSKHFGASVISSRLSGLGGAKNYQVVTISKEHNRLCLKKRNVYREDQLYSVEEDVTVEFISIEK